jgi:hypothetical protein
MTSIAETRSAEETVDRSARTDVAILSEFLRHRDIPCPSCRYNLRGLRRGACPECGAPLSLHVGTPRIAISGWLLALLASAVPFGFALVLLGLAIFGALVQVAWLPGDWNALPVIAVAAALSAGFVFLIARRREELIDLAFPLRWLAGAAAVFAAIIETVVFVAILGHVLE